MKRKILLLLAVVIFSFMFISAKGIGKNILTMSTHSEFGTIDPACGTDMTETLAMVNLYDALVFPDSTGELQPKLAKSWTVSPDGLTYTFKIKHGVKFHDGSELTAEDVKFSMDRALALKSGVSWLWMGVVKETVVEDRYTVTFHLSKPFAPFLPSLCWLFVVNKDAVLAHKEQGEFGEFGDYGKHWLSATTTEDAGSGPYTLKSWDRGREIVFERFPDYFEGWPKGNKSIDEVHVIMVWETATLKMMLRKGELTMTEHMRTYSDYQEMDKYPNARVITFPSTEQFSFKLNTKIPPTDDIHIRRMLAWAFDYKTVCDIIEPGSIRARGPVPPTIPGHNPRVFQYHQDLDKAREELKLSKYYPNIPTITLVTTPVERRRKMALLLKGTLAKLGVNLDIHLEPWGRITDLARTVETTANIMGISVSSLYPDPDSYLYSIYHSKAAGTWMSTEWLQNPFVDQLIEQERMTVDRETRRQLMNIAQQVIVEYCPDIFVYVFPIRIAAQNYVKGFTFRPVISFYYYFHDLWYEK